MQQEFADKMTKFGRGVKWMYPPWIILYETIEGGSHNLFLFGHFSIDCNLSSFDIAFHELMLSRYNIRNVSLDDRIDCLLLLVRIHQLKCFKKNKQKLLRPMFESH